MARRPPSRWLAPLAIVVVGGAAYGILKSGIGDSSTSRSSPEPASQRPSDRSPADGTTTSAAPTRRTYVVRSGDTLSSISLETGVSVARLQSLNPDIDVQALQPGQRLNLRS